LLVPIGAAKGFGTLFASFGDSNGLGTVLVSYGASKGFGVQVGADYLQRNYLAIC
jgi:hypothetical protein